MHSLHIRYGIERLSIPDNSVNSGIKQQVTSPSQLLGKDAPNNQNCSEKVGDSQSKSGNTISTEKNSLVVQYTRSYGRSVAISEHHTNSK